MSWKGSAGRKWLLAAAGGVAASVALVVGIGTLSAQGGEEKWVWSSGLMSYTIPSTVSIHVANESSQQQQVTMQIFGAGGKVAYQRTESIAPGAGALASPSCGAGFEICDPESDRIRIRVVSSSPQIVPSGLIQFSGDRYLISAGDMMLVSPRGGDAAASVGGLDAARATRRQLQRTQKKILKRLKRIERRLP